MMQVLILVKYLRQSHEMMKVKHKYLLTMVNNEKDKSKHSQNKEEKHLQNKEVKYSQYD